MRAIFIFFSIFYFLNARAQEKRDTTPSNYNYELIAQNAKHKREYFNGYPLKIQYHSNGQIKKAKGRLLIYDSKRIKLVPFGKKDIIMIQVDSISSVGMWSRNTKIATAVIAGTGVLAIGLALAMPSNHTPGIADGNILGFMLVLYSIIDLWYVAIAVPTIYLKEIISKRSDKRGYHFFVQEAG